MSNAILSAAELAQNKLVARTTYRRLLRSISIAFNPDSEHRDLNAFTAARKTARSEFQNSPHRPGSVEAGEALLHAQGVAQILRENVVQGRHAGGEKYKLNIHKDTQRLDNHTAGELKGTTKSFKEIKNGTF